MADRFFKAVAQGTDSSVLQFISCKVTSKVVWIDMTPIAVDTIQAFLNCTSAALAATITNTILN